MRIPGRQAGNQLRLGHCGDNRGKNPDAFRSPGPWIKRKARRRRKRPALAETALRVALARFSWLRLACIAGANISVKSAQTVATSSTKSQGRHRVNCAFRRRRPCRQAPVTAFRRQEFDETARATDWHQYRPLGSCSFAGAGWPPGVLPCSALRAGVISRCCRLWPCANLISLPLRRRRSVTTRRTAWRARRVSGCGCGFACAERPPRTSVPEARECHPARSPPVLRPPGYIDDRRAVQRHCRAITTWHRPAPGDANHLLAKLGSSLIDQWSPSRHAQILPSSMTISRPAFTRDKRQQMLASRLCNDRHRRAVSDRVRTSA